MYRHEITGHTDSYEFWLLFVNAPTPRLAKGRVESLIAAGVLREVA